MRQVFFVCLFFGLLFGGDKFNLTIKVDNLRNSNGVVQFSLYNKDGTIVKRTLKLSR